MTALSDESQFELFELQQIPVSCPWCFLRSYYTLMAQIEEEELKRDESSQQGKSSFQKFSYIFEGNNNPAFANTKSNLLIILLCISVYFLFSLVSDFGNIILLGFLFGVGYGKLRERFVDFWKRQSKSYKVVDNQKIVVCALQLILSLTLPWLAHLCELSQGEAHFQPKQIFQLFYSRSNIWVRIAQIFLFINIVYKIWGNFIDDILFIRNMNSRVEKVLKTILALIVIIMAIVIFILFVTTIAIELRNAGLFVVSNFEKYYNCKFAMGQLSDEQKFQGIFCQQKIPENLKQFVPKIDQKSLKACMKRIGDLQLKYLGYKLQLFEENLCTGVNILEQLNPNFLSSINTQTTGYAFTVLFGIFGIIVKLILLVTNGIFNLTTFLSIFIVTLSNYEHTTRRHLHIFGHSKEKLVSNISLVIQATFFIALEHLVFSIAFLEIIDFSSFNVLLSILLSMVAFIPYVKPSLMMGIMIMVNMGVEGRYVANGVYAGVYWLVSEYIYSRNYSEVGLHMVIINLSVIFGIYQFGVSGILYGPLIVILFESVYDEIFR